MNCKEKLRELIIGITSSSADIFKLAGDMEIDDMSPADIKNKISTMFTLIYKLSRKLEDAIHLLPLTSYERLDIPAAGKMFYNADADVYIITLHNLLPKRPTVNFNTGTLIKTYEKDILYNSYRKIIEEYINNGNVININKEPIHVHFNNIYQKDSIMADFDNLEQKVFIDAVVNKTFISDDSPEYLSYSMGFEYGEYNHTEVIIGSLQKIQKYKSPRF